jgi:thioredoxin 1
MVTPVLEEVFEEYHCNLEIYKVDTEAEQELAGKFGIRNIPSILFVPKNDKLQMSMGALPKKTYQQLIKEALGLKEPCN